MENIKNAKLGWQSSDWVSPTNGWLMCPKLKWDGNSLLCDKVAWLSGSNKIDHDVSRSVHGRFTWLEHDKQFELRVEMYYPFHSMVIGHRQVTSTSNYGGETWASGGVHDEAVSQELPEEVVGTRSWYFDKVTVPDGVVLGWFGKTSNSYAFVMDAKLYVKPAFGAKGCWIPMGEPDQLRMEE